MDELIKLKLRTEELAAEVDYWRTIAESRWSLIMLITKGDSPSAESQREKIALKIEQMGIEGYGTLAIAAAIRSDK